MYLLQINNIVTIELKIIDCNIIFLFQKLTSRLCTMRCTEYKSQLAHRDFIKKWSNYFENNPLQILCQLNKF